MRRPAVGRQLRRWRTDRGLTLSALAARSGLNVGYLSQVETEKASPSLDTLAALADALDVPIAWLFVDDERAPRLVKPIDRPVRVGPGGARVERVDGGLAQDLSIVEVRAAPGFRTGIHAHVGDEHHVVLEGSWRLVQGEHVVEAGPGDYVVWDGTVPHDAEVVGAEQGVMLIVSLRGGGRAHHASD